MSGGLPLALRTGQPFRGAAFNAGTPLDQDMWQAMGAPEAAVHPVAVARIDGLAAHLARATGDRDNPALRADWIARGLQAPVPRLQQTLLSHPFHAALATAYSRTPVTAECVDWTCALLGAMRLAWPAGHAFPNDPNDAQYRASLLLRRLFAHPQWSDITVPAPAIPLPARISVATLSCLPVRLRDTLVEACTALARAHAPKRKPVAGLPVHTLATTRLPCRDRHATSFAIALSVEAMERFDDADDVEDAEAFDTYAAMDAPEGLVASLAEGGALAEGWLDEQDTDEATRRLRGGQLTSAEFARHFNAFAEHAIGPEDRDRAQIVMLAVGLLGIAWAELPLALHASTVDDIELDTPRPGLVLVRREGGDWEGWRPVRRPPLPPPPMGSDPTCFLPASEYFRLPVHPAIASALAQRLGRLRGAGVRTHGAIECLHWPARSLGLEAYERHVDLLRGGRAGRRLEAGRVPSIFARALDMDASIEAAARASLQPGEAGYVPTAAFYTCLNVAQLATQYLTAQSRIVSELGPTLPMPAGDDGPVLSWPSGWTGSRRCPHPDTLVRAACALRGARSASKCDARNALHRWVEHHNARCQAFAFALHAGAGLRRSRHALRDARVDLADGWLAIRDKGPLERLVPLSSRLRGDWEATGRHLEAFWHMACLAPPGISAPVVRMRDAWHAGALAPAALTLLETDGRALLARPWQPADLDDALHQIGVSVPVQCLRHAARTAWAACAAPESDVDALSGHYRRGAEPWTAFGIQTIDSMLARLSTLVEQRLGQLDPDGEA